MDQNRWRIDFPHSSDACRAASGNCKCKSTPSGKRVLVIGALLIAVIWSRLEEMRLPVCTFIAMTLVMVWLAGEL